MFQIVGYKTPAAVRAIHNMKVSVKKNVLTFEDIIPNSSKELKSKKDYMQGDAFWKDEHNVKMFGLYDRLLSARDKIAENIRLNNAKPNAEIQVQGCNGYSRIKKYLDKNPKMNFMENPTFRDNANNEYSLTRTLIYNASRAIKSKIGR